MIEASMVVGANGATSLGGSSALLRNAIDRERFLTLRQSSEFGAILVGRRTTLVEPYGRAPHPLVIFSRSSLVGNASANSIRDFVANVHATYPGKILCEGGIWLIHKLLAEGLIDTFHISRVAIDGDDHFLDEALLLRHMELVSSEIVGQTRLEKLERS